MSTGTEADPDIPERWKKAPMTWAVIVEAGRKAREKKRAEMIAEREAAKQKTGEKVRPAKS